MINDIIEVDRISKEIKMDGVQDFFKTNTEEQNDCWEIDNIPHWKIRKFII